MLHQQVMRRVEVLWGLGGRGRSSCSRVKPLPEQSYLDMKEAEAARACSS